MIVSGAMTSIVAVMMVTIVMDNGGGDHGVDGGYDDVDEGGDDGNYGNNNGCLLYTSPSPRDQRGSRMPSSA